MTSTERANARRKAGLCTQCGKPRDKSSLCEKCARKNRKRMGCKKPWRIGGRGRAPIGVPTSQLSPELKTAVRRVIDARKISFRVFTTETSLDYFVAYRIIHNGAQVDAATETRIAKWCEKHKPTK